MSRRNNSQQLKHTSVTVPLDEELAMALDRTMIAFGLENRAQTARMAIASWVAAMMEESTIHLMVQQAVTEIRKNEFQALSDYYEKRAREMRG